MQTHMPAHSASTPFRNIAAAFMVVIATISGEYFFRHYVMFWFPTVGNLQVNDMISLLMLYALLVGTLGLALRTNWLHELQGLRLSLWDLITKWEYVPWLLLLALSAALLPPLDRYFWGKAKPMPWLTSSYRNPATWFSAQASIIKAAALLCVNGLLVPVAEEFIWRGLVQTRLLRITTAPVAIGATAICFSLKHVVVDDSFGRFLFIIAFGVICGVVACRKSWRVSAAVHIFANTVGTIVALATGLLT